MKRVLILTYYWPPSGGAGVQRWLKFVKYMRGFGIEPVVYTVQNGEMPVVDESLVKEVPAGTEILRTPIWEPYTIYKRFIGRKKEDKINASFLNENKKTGVTEKISIWIRGNFFIPDARKFWINPSIAFLNDYLLKNKVDYVISSGPPHSMHLIAAGLKKKHPSLPWVADFRDPWTNIDFYEKLMLTPLADAKHHRLEKQVLLESDCVLSIGQAMSDEFKAMYVAAGGTSLSKFEVITNGYDQEDVLLTAPKKDARFSIAHIGTLVKDRNPNVLWQVLSKLCKDQASFADQLEIKLVGKVDLFVKEEIEKFGLSKYVRKIDYLPHNEVMVEQQRSRVLLLLVNNTKNAKGILTGKVFEYMAAKCPILAIGPVDGELATILHETGTGAISDFSDALTLEKNILAFFNGTTTARKEEKVEQYSRKALTGKLCDLLKRLDQRVS